VASAELPLALVEEDFDGLAATNVEYFNNASSQRFPDIEHTQQEWIPWSVYVRNASVSIRFRFYNPNTTTTYGVFYLTDPRYRPVNHPLDEVVLSGSGLQQSVVVPAGGYKDVTVTLTGLPTTVCTGELWLKVDIEAAEGNPYIEGDPTMRQHLFFADAAPAGLMSVPWIEVIAKACDWADEQTGPSACATGCTFGLYYWQVFFYPFNEDGFPSSYISAGVFELSEFIQRENEWTWGNCVDVSAYLHLTLSSIGVSNSLKRHRSVLQFPRTGFVTNPICGIGSDPTIGGNYALVAWNMHQNVAVDSLVYEPTFALPIDLAGDPYENPPAGWLLQAYWQTPFGNDFVGAIKRYAYDGNDIVYPMPQVIDPGLSSESVVRVTSSVSLGGIE